MEKYPDFKILIVDDEEYARQGMERALLSNGINNVLLVDSGESLLRLLKEHSARIVLLDLMMPGLSGEELLKRVKEEFPEISVIIITGRNEVDTVVRCMRLGAYDYLVKPVPHEDLFASVKRVIELQALSLENTKVKKLFFEPELTYPEAFNEIITNDSRMLAVFKYTEAIACGRQPILISGETGTGKELIAKAIHKVRGDGSNFVPVNIAEFTDAMVGDALFGHVKGAYTGADSKRMGFVESANNGTLFLDEISELNRDAQFKLLRLLQEREYVPIGSDTVKLSTARVVTATNQDLESLVKDGRFRKDLYFRLRTHNIRLLPLRERRGDIPLLLSHFIGEAAKEFNKARPNVSHDLLCALENYEFPGNVREFKSMVFDAVGCSSGTLSIENFSYLPKTVSQNADAGTSLPTLKKVMLDTIQEALRVSGGNQSAAARMLGISHQALNKRLKNMDWDF